MHMKKLMLAVMGLAAVAGGPARAAGIAVDLQSARGVGMAGSLIGAVDDATGIYFNPAGIARRARGWRWRSAARRSSRSSR